MLSAGDMQVDRVTGPLTSQRSPLPKSKHPFTSSGANNVSKRKPRHLPESVTGHPSDAVKPVPSSFLFMSEWSDLSRVAGHGSWLTLGGTELLASAPSLGAGLGAEMSLPLEPDRVLPRPRVLRSPGGGWPEAALCRREHGCRVLGHKRQ